MNRNDSKFIGPVIFCVPQAPAHLTSTSFSGTPDSTQQRHRGGLEIMFPDDFTVFCSRRLSLYTRYGALRVHSLKAGREAAIAALGDLAMCWPEALASPSPAALSWQLLTGRVAYSARDRGADSLHATLSGRQADAVLLRYRIGLSAPEAAEAMGVDAGEVLAAVRAALRALPQRHLVR
ncbi:hypothetical protein ACFW9I_33500 [[Kitasatospora] papulosa]|uniref:hypothetical protein n=1 Tax=[Kitasatospora] papulosa TaxID=1464011 RepID=UPI0036C87D50